MKRALTLLPLTVLALAACGSDDEVSIENAWARATADGQPNGAIYFDLTVDADDVLLGAEVPSSVAGDAQVHEVVMAEIDESMDETGEPDETDESGEMSEMDDDGDSAGSGDMDDMDDMDEMDDMDGAMVMRELESGLALTAGETVVFQPGGYHVMLLDLAAPLEIGDEVELTLEFAAAGETTLTVEVAETAP